MILDTEELIEAMSNIIQEIDGHKDVIEKIESNVDTICNLESLQGEGGSAIKEHFMTLHLPVLLLTQQFIEAYKGHMKQVESNLLVYDTDNTLVRLSYLEDVKGDLNQVINYTQESADTINASYNRVSDLVNTGPLEISSLIEEAKGAKDQIDDSEEALLESDDANHAILNEAKQLLDHFGNLVNKVEGWIGDDVELSPKTLEEISAYFQDSQTVNQLMDDEAMESIIENLSNGEELTNSEKMLVYHYIRNEVVDEDTMEEVANKMATDPEAIADYLNEHVVTSPDALIEELDMVELYLNSHVLMPDGNVPSQEIGYLRAYEKILKDAETSMVELAELTGMAPEDINKDTFFIRAEHIFEKPTDQNMTILQADFAMEVVQDNFYNTTREEWMENDYRLGFRQNTISEVTYYFDEDAGSTMGNWAKAEIGEDYENHTANFIHGAITSKVVKALYNQTIGRVGQGAKDAGEIWGEINAHDREETEKKEDKTLRDVEDAATNLFMEVRVSERNRNGLDIELYQTEYTEQMLERWNEVHEFDSNFSYPREDIEEQNWPSVSDEWKYQEELLRREHEYGDFNFYRYIMYDEGDLQEALGEEE